MAAPTIMPMVPARSLGAKCQASSRNSHAQLIQRLDSLEARIDRLFKELSGQISKLHADMVTIYGHTHTEQEKIKAVVADMWTEVMIAGAARGRSISINPASLHDGEQALLAQQAQQQRNRGGTVTGR